MSRWPKTVLQFEDFQLQYAHTLLQRYKHLHLVFNDDIQVHACACVGGVLKLGQELSRTEGRREHVGAKGGQEDWVTVLYCTTHDVRTPAAAQHSACSVKIMY